MALPDKWKDPTLKQRVLLALFYKESGNPHWASGDIETLSVIFQLPEGLIKEAVEENLMSGYASKEQDK